MNFSEIQKLTEQYVLGSYGRFPVAFVKGEGCYIWDSEGKKYLDLLSGVAVSALGYAHPAINQVVAEQCKTLMHTSNLFYIEPQTRLAQFLVEHSFADKVFFCNSGAEANEAAIKLARRWAQRTKGPDCYEIICMEKSFHGRTIATMTATGQDRIKKDFGPLPIGFVHVPYDDVAAVEQAINKKTCAILVEPIQGEGGVCIPQSGYLQSLRKICDENNLLLILDEVQTGTGRTGKLFAYEYEGIEPDILSMAKALGSGIPMGACLSKDHVAKHIGPGDHATTFGGNFLASAVALRTLEIMVQEGLLENCKTMGQYFIEQLTGLAKKIPQFKKVWGRGLMIGIELSQEIPGLVNTFLQAGLILNVTQGNIIRLVPPLIIQKTQIDESVELFETIFASL